jgi:hypothetical protein
MSHIPPPLPDAHLKPHRATMVLMFGVIGLVVCQPFGIAAWLMGNNDLREMRAGRMDPDGKDQTNAGRILGIVATVLLLVQLALITLFLLFFGGLAAFWSNHG